MKQQDLLDAFGQLPQDLIAEALPKHQTVSAPADDGKPAAIRVRKNKGNPNIALRLGAAVAAVCFIASGAFVYSFLRVQKNKGAQTSLTSELSEQKQGNYVKLMQDYYSLDSETPCTYDFSGMGTDLNETWELDNCSVTLNAVAGDAFQLFYFYDIKLKEGTEWDGTAPILHLSADYKTGGEDHASAAGIWSPTESRPNRLLAEEEGVKHYAGVLQNLFGLGFDEAEIHAHLSETDSSGVTGEARQINSDFISAPRFTDIYDPNGTLNISGCPLRKAAVTPLCVYFTSAQPVLSEQSPLFSQNVTDFPAAPEECGTWEMALMPYTATDSARTLTTRLQNSCMMHWDTDLTTLMLPFAEPLDKNDFLRYYLSVNGCAISLGNPLPSFVPETSDTEYGKLMQEYYATDYDFTGMGMDLNVEFCYPQVGETYVSADQDLGGGTIRLIAAAGDCYTLHLFFDVIADHPESFYVNSVKYCPDLALTVSKDGKEIPLWRADDTLTHQDGSGIWHEHMCITSADGTPLSGAALQMTATVYDNFTQCEPFILNFLPEKPEIEAVMDPTPVWHPIQVTPLGVYSFTDVTNGTDSESGMYPLDAVYEDGTAVSYTVFMPQEMLDEQKNSGQNYEYEPMLVGKTPILTDKLVSFTLRGGQYMINKEQANKPVTSELDCILNADSVTPDGLRITFRNRSAQDTYYVTTYRNTVLTADGEPIFDVSAKDVVSVSTIGPNNEITLEFEWASQYGSLKPGSYKLLLNYGLRTACEMSEYLEFTIPGDNAPDSQPDSQSDEPTDSKQDSQPDSQADHVPGRGADIEQDTVTPTGLTVILINGTDEVQWFSPEFQLFRKGSTKPLIQDASFYAIVFDVQPHSSRNYRYDWTEYCGELEPGEYEIEIHYAACTYQGSFTVR
ncbi:MAG: DUF4179 domain-containing protein [Oscillospiraceae bacterium]|nr:DUF4179 domain-containing protein [Oscillospiraceae bacterium]